MNGSGTTMLLDCLNGHPDLFGFRRETKILPYFIQSSQKYGDLSKDKNFKKMWDDFRRMSCFKYVNNGKAVPLPEDWPDTPRNVAGVIDRTFLYFADKEGKSRWCEKTPMHAQHICLLARTFPEARFIHIIRDGRACAASFHRRWRYTPELTIYRWKSIALEARRQGQTIPDRYFELRYEDLTDSPETWLKKLCDFLQIPDDRRMVTLSRVRKHSGSSESKITRRSEYWRDYFTPQKLEALEQIAGKALHNLGYSTDNPDRDDDPSWIRIKYWTYKDNIRQGLHYIRKEMSRGKRHGKWTDLSERILDAIRQRISNRI